MVASISATIFLCGMLVGVGANLEPFSKRDCSSAKSVFLERFTTQLFLLMSAFLVPGLFKLESFLACLAYTDRSDYDNKMETLLNDKSTYEVVSKSPFRRIEREPCFFP